MKDKYVLGIHIGHDRGASIVKNGKLVSHIAQDRLDRVKHSESPEIPFEAINVLLKDCNIKPANLSSVGISFVNVEIGRFKTYLKDAFCHYYKLNEIDFYPVSHHLAHAIAVNQTSGFKESMILIADGAGDAVGDKLESETLYYAENGNITEIKKRLHEIELDISGRPFLYNYGLMNLCDRKKQISIAKKYEQFTNLLGFGHFQDGKTMGLSSYGRPLVNIANFPVKDFDFSLRCDDLLKQIHSLKLDSKLSYPLFIKKHSANLAATIQAFIENIILRLIESQLRFMRSKRLCLAGGLFLNCVANHKIVMQGYFKDIFIFPAAGDDGQSVGAAFYAYKQSFKYSKSLGKFIPFLGPKYTDHKIKRAIEKFNLKYDHLSLTELVKKAANHLDKGKVIGIMRGRSEIGPRALCHRSLLADPRPASMKRHLNHKVKFREEFRPYAPVVTREDQFKYFDLAQESPYMLLAAKVRLRYKNKLKAITHVDGTARVQAISRDDDNFIYSLLKEFEKITGYPVLLNTSFNIAGEPIVETPHDALSTFASTKIDVLIMENFIIEKD